MQRYINNLPGMAYSNRKQIKMTGFKLFFLSLVFLAGCDQNKLPEGVISEQKMIRILSDLHTMDGYISTLHYSDSVKRIERKKYLTVYKKHQITPGIFEKSLKYYSMNPTLLDSMYSQVEIILLKQEVKLTKKSREVNRKLLEKK